MCKEVVSNTVSKLYKKNKEYDVVDELSRACEADHFMHSKFQPMEMIDACHALIGAWDEELTDFLVHRDVSLTGPDHGVNISKFCGY